MVGGFSLGIVEQLTAGYIDSSLADVAPFVLIIVVLLLRPRGLFGRRAVVKM